MAHIPYFNVRLYCLKRKKEHYQIHCCEVKVDIKHRKERGPSTALLFVY